LGSFIFITDMPTEITISGLTGASPFNVYTCDTGYTTCIWVTGFTSGDIPLVFDLPFIQEGMDSIGLKVVDNNGCIIQENLT
jgi:hypothetical protein